MRKKKNRRIKYLRASLAVLPVLAASLLANDANGVTLTPEMLDFGYQLVGRGNAQKNLMITNSDSRPSVITDINIIGGDRDDFAAAYNFSLPVTLQPSHSVVINFSFLPALPWKRGSRDARLKIKIDGSYQFIPLTGIGATCDSLVWPHESGGVCVDSDGDGFSDNWEDNDYIDLNNNGRKDSEDFPFPHQRPFLFSDVTHVGTGTGVVFPTVIDPAQPITDSNVVVSISSGGRLGTAQFTYRANGGPVLGPLTVRSVVNLTSNLRLMFYAQNFTFVAGDTYSFSVSMSPEQKVADRNVPNIYLQYDYMGWAEPGAVCTSDDDAPPQQPNLVCHEGHLNHNHYPGDPLFRKVVDPFAAHGITLYINPVHQAVPHAAIVTWAKASDPDSGPRAICAGWDIVAGDISNGNAVSFFDIKNRPGSDFAMQPFRRFIYRYAVFGHLNTCLTDDWSAEVGACSQCPTDRSTPSGAPAAGGSGVAELPGNDFIISLAQSLNNPLGSVSTNPFFEGGVFMHELGHNLGLHHAAGNRVAPEDAPNYLSVMNPKYVFSGIQHAATPGSAVAVESLRTLDYSEHELSTLDESNLDESAGVSPLSAGYTGIVHFYNGNGANGVGPESGPIDWSGNGAIDTSPVSVDLNGWYGATETMRGYADWIHGPCISSADTPINYIRQFHHDLVDPSIDPHEPCVQGRAQSLWLSFQNTQWSKAD